MTSKQVRLEAKQYPVGSVINEYEVVSCIAETQTSALFKVVHTSVHKPLVLKIYASDISDKRLLDKFLLEANLMHEFSHSPFINNALHVGDYQERPFYTMHYYPQNLSSMLALNNQKLSVTTSLDITRQLLQGLVDIHNQQILHLDLKPQNILLDEHQRLKITDFGNALILRNSALKHLRNQYSHSGNLSAYTSEYACEQLIEYVNKNHTESLDTDAAKQKPLGLIEPNIQWDFYSVGAILFRLLVGHPLNKNDSVLAQQNLAVYCNNELGKVAPIWLCKVILNLLGLGEDSYNNAQACIESIDKNVSQQEDFATMDINALNLSPKLLLLEQEIDKLLMDEGVIDQVKFDQLMSIHLTNESPFFNASKETSDNGHSVVGYSSAEEALNTLIQTRIDYLKTHHNLSQWFNWINYIINLQKSKPLKAGRMSVSSNEYQQILHLGRSALLDNDAKAKTIMDKYFTKKTGAFFLGSSKAMSLVVVICVFVILFIAYEPVNIEELINEQEHSDDNVNNAVWKHSKNSDSNVAESLLTEGLLTKGELLPSDKNNQSNTNSSIMNDTAEEMSLNANLSSISLKHPYIENKTISIEWIRVKNANGLMIMRHEVSQLLYQYCIDAGACRAESKIQRFSTRKIGQQAEQISNQEWSKPKVNVTWYEVTEQFIPWLNAYTESKYSLPTLQQWQKVAAETLSASGTEHIHCKNCRQSLKIQNRNQMVAIDVFDSDNIGLNHFFGNAQEWLQDCWNSSLKQGSQGLLHEPIQRCDQAIVAGGSYMQTKDEFNTETFDRLLKNTSSATVGFRLIRLTNE